MTDVPKVTSVGLPLLHLPPGAAASLPCLCGLLDLRDGALRGDSQLSAGEAALGVRPRKLMWEGEGCGCPDVVSLGPL